MGEQRLKGLAWILVIVVAFILALTTSCGDETAAVDNADDLLDRWKAAGLEVGDHAALDKPALGKSAECKRGLVSGVETTICRYPSDKAAAAAQAAGLELVGATTGAALPRGKVLLVVADRSKADSDGKIINKLTKLFRGR